MGTQQQNGRLGALGNGSISAPASTRVAPATCPVFRRLLVCIDFSPSSASVLAEAVSLARAAHGHILLLHVSQYVSLSPRWACGGDLFSEAPTCEARLAGLLTAVHAEGISAEAVVRRGLTADRILDAADELRADLIIVGTEGTSGLERLAFGSTAEAVLLQATCAVMTVGRRAPAPRDPQRATIVFATDFHTPMTRAMFHAASLASVRKGPLHCLHVLPMSLKDREPSSEAGPAEGATHPVPSLMSTALQHLAESCHICPATCAIAYGEEISLAVAEYARQHDAAAIVLGVRRGKRILAHLAAHCLHQILVTAPCPVITVAYSEESDLPSDGH